MFYIVQRCRWAALRSPRIPLVSRFRLNGMRMYGDISRYAQFQRETPKFSSPSPVEVAARIPSDNSGIIYCIDAKTFPLGLRNSFMLELAEKQYGLPHIWFIVTNAEQVLEETNSEAYERYRAYYFEALKGYIPGIVKERVHIADTRIGVPVTQLFQLPLASCTYYIVGAHDAGKSKFTRRLMNSARIGKSGSCEVSPDGNSRYIEGVNLTLVNLPDFATRQGSIYNRLDARTRHRLSSQYHRDAEEHTDELDGGSFSVGGFFYVKPAGNSIDYRRSMYGKARTYPVDTVDRRLKVVWSEHRLPINGSVDLIIDDVGSVELGKGDGQDWTFRVPSGTKTCLAVPSMRQSLITGNPTKYVPLEN